MLNMIKFDLVVLVSRERWMSVEDIRNFKTGTSKCTKPITDQEQPKLLL